MKDTDIKKSSVLGILTATMDSEAEVSLPRNYIKAFENLSINKNITIATSETLRGNILSESNIS